MEMTIQTMGDIMSSGNDMKAAQQSYSGFLSMIKYSMPVIALITVLVIFLLTR